MMIIIITVLLFDVSALGLAIVLDFVSSATGLLVNFYLRPYTRTAGPIIR